MWQSNHNQNHFERSHADSQTTVKKIWHSLLCTCLTHVGTKTFAENNRWEFVLLKIFYFVFELVYMFHIKHVGLHNK